MNYYDLEVEDVIKQSNPAEGPDRKKQWDIRTDIWMDVPFQLTAKKDGEEFCVRGTLSQAPKGRLRLAITIRRAGSDWRLEIQTTVELVPKQRQQIGLVEGERSFVTLRQRAPDGLVLRRKAHSEIAQKHTRKYE